MEPGEGAEVEAADYMRLSGCPSSCGEGEEGFLPLAM